MLVEAAIPLGLRPLVMVASEEEPAARFSPSLVGDTSDDLALESFLKKVDLVVFESEFVPCERIARVARQMGTSAPRFFPSLAVLSELADKTQQKLRLDRLGLATAEFRIHDPAESWRDWLGRSVDELGGSAVLKWGRMGYDGKGVLPVKACGGAWPEIVPPFCEAALGKGIPLYLERLVKFTRELAVVAVVSSSGEKTGYPLVVSTQTDGICRLVMGPATALGVSATREKEALQTAFRLAEATGLVGAFAVEFFDAPEGLLVNEIAPRVHNSGHYTQNAASTSQFENHLRAAVGLSLGSTRTAPGFAMLNLLGFGHARPVSRIPGPSSVGWLHWYDKTEIRNGRKMGHLNAVCDNPTAVPEVVKDLEQAVKLWQMEDSVGKEKK